MTTRRRSAFWRQARAAVLAAVVLVGGFGLPAFDVIAYHWHPAPASTREGLPRIEPFGTPAEHAVQCVLTHNAPVPRLTAPVTCGLEVTLEIPDREDPRPATVPATASRHLPDQPRAPPRSIA